MNAHIINCFEADFLNIFRQQGYIGVPVIVRGTRPKQLSYACTTSYSMFADMITIRRNDMIFVHAGQKIYGVFKAEGEFLEDPTAPPMYLSQNVHYRPDPNRPGSGWQGTSSLPPSDYPRCLAISNFTDDNSINLCFPHGFNSTEVFELKLKRKIWTTPERWKYEDKARIVRPLMMDEALEISRLLDRVNSDNRSRLTIVPRNLSGFTNIKLILNPNIVTNEKIIEGWILENIGRNAVLDSALGSMTSFGNNVPAGYLKFMDIFGYHELPTGTRKYKVCEIKKDESTFPNDINQLLGYMDWIVENIASGEYKAVEGILIAKGFSDDCIGFVRNFNSINSGRDIRLIRFDYVPPDYNNLNIIRVM